MSWSHKFVGESAEAVKAQIDVAASFNYGLSPALAGTLKTIAESIPLDAGEVLIVETDGHVDQQAAGGTFKISKTKLLK